MNELTSRFVSAFNSIEKRLEEIARPNDYIPFGVLVDKAANNNKAVLQFRKKLKYLGNIRNFFVHDYTHGKEVAVPTERIIREVEALAVILTSPPSLLSIASKTVHSCRPSDSVGAAARKMHDNAFSQLPIYEGEKLVGLLTGETIVRWLASRLERDGGMLEDEPVNQVLKHQETKASYNLAVQTATVFDGLREFDKALHAGMALQAVIVTANGKDTETPLGIVTPSDIPKMVQVSKLEG